MSLRSEPLGPRRWLLLVVLLVFARGALVLSLGDVFFSGEELEKGTAAKAMLDGLDVPHHQLAYHAYEGGGFVASHLAALGFLILGECLLVHKVIALVWQLALLFVGVRVARELFGARAALWFGLLFVFAPVSYQKLGLLDLGIHFEACVFLFGVLGLGARILFAGGERERPRDYLVLGLVTGFGIYYSYQVAVAAFYVLVLIVATRPRALVDRRGLAGLFGTIVGALPLLLMATAAGSAVFDIHGAALAAGGDGPGNGARVLAFLDSIFVGGALGGRVGPFVWTVAVLAALVGLLICGGGRSGWSEDDGVVGAAASGALAPRRCALFIAGYLALFLVVYLASGFVHGRVYHFFLVLRLVPLWLFGALLVAAGLGALMDAEGRRARRLALVAGTLLVALGVRGTWQAASEGRPGTPLANLALLRQYKGYAYRVYLHKVLPRFAGDRRAKLARLEALDEPDRAWLRAETADALFRQAVLEQAEGDVVRAYALVYEDVLAVCAGDEACVAEYQLGLGGLLIEGSGWDRSAALAQVEAAPEPLRGRLAEALGRFGEGIHAVPEALQAALARASGSSAPEAYRRGLGRWSHARYRLHPERARAAFASFPPEVAEALEAGEAAERAWNLLP